MTTGIEEPLRRKLRDIAERAQPESIRPLQVPPPRRWSRTVRWLAPVAAAAAVAGLIAGLAVAGHTAGQLPSSQPIPGGMPKYYVSLAASTQHHVTVVTATVHTSATGAKLASVQLPGYRIKPGLAGLTGYWTTAAASDRLFVIGDPNGLYALRLAANGSPEPPSKLPIRISGGDGFLGGALSPNGALLALDTRPCLSSQRSCPDGIVVFSLATGTGRTWLTQDAYLAPANWTANGRKLFLYYRGGYRLLTVAGPGGSLLADSVPIASPVGLRGWSAAADLGAMITPDGRSVITGDFGPGQGPFHPSTWYRARLLEFSAVTGRLQRVLYVWGPTHTSLFFPEMSSLALTGLHVLVGVDGIGFGRLDGTHFTLLSGSYNVFGVW
jgi:hypothetical protein